MDATETPKQPHARQEAALALLVLEHELVDTAEAAKLILEARKSGLPPLEHAFERGILSRSDVLLTAAEELGIPAADLDAPESRFSIDRDLLEQFDAAELEQLQVLPAKDGDQTIVLAADPDRADAVDWVGVHLSDAPLVLTPKDQLDEILLTELAVLATSQLSRELEAGNVDGVGAEAPVRRWLSAMLDAAVAQRASDIHLQQYADGSMTVRFRIDGVLIAQPSPPAGVEDNVLGAAMAMATMDTANRREDQDTAFEFTSQGRPINVRASMMPTVTGPKLVFRILDSTSMRVGLEQLGFSDQVLPHLVDAMQRSNGTMLVTGPTGSGKTTTLYSLLERLTTPERNVTTVEDPVEYRLQGIAQTEVRTRAEEAKRITFSRALRTILRQDPDIIMLGEIRDAETAEVSMEAAVTGHLVLTSVHAPDAIGTYTRLMRMGVPTYQLAQAITVVVSQRLLRRSHSCAKWVTPDEEERAYLEEIGAGRITRVRREVGCQRCYGTGFRGRVAVAELLVPGKEFRSAVELNATAAELDKVSSSGVHITFGSDAVRHLETGATTVSEVSRVLKGLI